MIPKESLILLSIWTLWLIPVSACVQNREPEIIARVVVHQEDGYFMGWPANNGVWSWDDGEIIVGFTRGPFVIKNTSMHFIDPPYQSWFAGSQDGGRTWRAFKPRGFVNDFDPEGLTGDSTLTLQELTRPLNFQDENLMLRVVGNGYLQPHVSEAGFFYSLNRGESWAGPFAFKGLAPAEAFAGMGEFTPRTDYIVESKTAALLFLSVRTPKGSDKAFVARTTDGGLTFKFTGWIVDPVDDPFRAVMPATVKTSSGKLISAVRRREVKRRDLYPHCWIDVYVSADNGASWKFASRAAETGVSNGNPPAMIQLADGRLLLVYGNREHCQIRARFSPDEGYVWGPEMILCEGVQPDFGYPRLVQNPDGNIVTLFYWAESSTSEKFIKAIIWNPGNEWSKPLNISN